MATDKRLLVDAIFNELKYKGHIIKHKNYVYYYDNAYGALIREIYRKKGFTRDSEFIKGSNNLTKGCSITSSARLCFLYLYDDIMADLVVPEKGMKNDLKQGGLTYFDAYRSEGEVYYEAKSQEITDDKGLLSVSYKDSSTLFKEFKIDEDKMEIVEKWSKKRQKSCYFFKFPISELCIVGLEDVSYNELKFDLKQLICHLIALANSDNENKKTLQYLFFTPSDEAIENNEVLKSLYDRLKLEIDAIWSSKKIIEFCKRHNIILAEPKFIAANSIEDKVYPAVEWKKSYL